MKIAPLWSYPQHIQAVISMLVEEFDPVNQLFPYAELVQHSVTPEQLPVTLVAMEGERLLGTVGLWRTDLMGRQDLCPWLACLVVDKALRGQGIGQALQVAVKAQAKQLGFPAVYLYTTLVNYYEKSGWQHMGESRETDGTIVQVYQYSL